MAGMNDRADELVLQVEDLSVEYRSRGTVLKVLPGVDLTMKRGRSSVSSASRARARARSH